MYESYRMSNTEQVATVGPQMVVGTRYWNEVAAATSHNHAYHAVLSTGEQDSDNIMHAARKGTT